MKSQGKQPQTALQKMQQIAERLTSNTPELLKYMDNDSILRKKDIGSGIVPTSKQKKGETAQALGLKNQMTSNDYFEKCKQIMAELAVYKEKNVKLENDLQVYKQRFVEREIQYRKIIEQLQQQLKNKSMLDPNEKARMQQIFQLHGKILENISTIQNKTSKILVQQESDIIRFFHKKINQIKQKFKQQRINKGEKDQQHIQKEKQLISQLQWMKNIAQKIDTQNQTLVKKYSQLKSEFEIQQNDRDMLVRELLMKKKKNAVLTSQIQQYQKLLQEVSKEVDEQEANDNVINRGQDSLDGQSAINLNVTNQSNTNKFKQLTKEDQTDPKRAMNTINTLKQTLSKQQKRVRQLKSLYMRQIQSKTQLQKILRKLVDDIKEQIMEIRAEARSVRKKQDEFGKQARTALIEKLLNNQKILTLIYDKTFYSQIKKGDFGKKNKVTEEPQMEGFQDDS